MANNGWIKIHRQITEWEWYDDIPAKVLFFHLLLTANHEDKKWHGILIKRGEKLTGRIKLAEETRLSEQSIRTALTKLKSTNEITIKTTPNYTIIKLNNYNKYQLTNQASNQRATNEQPTTNHKQELKELKKGYTSEFEKFWNAYPRKVGRNSAYQKFIKILDEVDAEILIKAVEAQKQNWDDPKFIPHPTTWLNQGRWKDEADEKLEPQKPQKAQLGKITYH